MYPIQIVTNYFRCHMPYSQGREYLEEGGWSTCGRAGLEYLEEGLEYLGFPSQSLALAVPYPTTYLTAVLPAAHRKL